MVRFSVDDVLMRLDGYLDEDYCNKSVEGLRTRLICRPGMANVSLIASCLICP